MLKEVQKRDKGYKKEIERKVLTDLHQDFSSFH